mmetsp:Transcript_23711/g.65897  ORF Transcript_23711/g.65897 Transcript_23711/m.65897 type:complete len:263 (-) Transcript_23711:134-922(-)
MTAEKQTKENNETCSLTQIDVPFKVKDLHKKALLTLWRSSHNGICLTYPDLSNALGVGEKTKSWQCEAWKELKKNELIVSGQKAKTWTLSEEGTQLALSLASPEEIDEYKSPLTNEEHHKKIRSKLSKALGPSAKEKAGASMGPMIFDCLLEHTKTPMTRLEICSKLPGKGWPNPESSGFFYGFRNLDKMGLVCTDGEASNEEMLELHQAFSAKQREGKKRKKSEDDSSSEGDEKKPRIRGGRKKYKLSEKAFLVTSEDSEE